MERVIKFRAWEEFPKYEVGDDGSIWSLNYNNSKKRREISQHLNKDGYPFVILTVNGVRFKRMVHRMVALTFIPNLENKPQVNHKNGKRDDSRAENLEWNTAKENCIHSFRSNGRKVSSNQKEKMRVRFTGLKNPKAKVNEDIVLSIRKLREKGKGLKEISTIYGISASQASAICTNRCWK